nr:hypothetical protein [Tanacetum cinerariifolium]
MRALCMYSTGMTGMSYLFNGIDDSMSVTKDPVALLYTMIVDRGAVSNEHANAPPENAREVANAHPAEVVAPIIMENANNV